AYVAHRLRVAGGREDLFSPAALTVLQRLSGGVPRLINIICDRALLGAYSLGLRQVGAPVVRQAAREALGLGAGGRQRRRLIAALAAGVTTLAVGLGTWLGYPPLSPIPPQGEARVVTADPGPADGAAAEGDGAAQSPQEAGGDKDEGTVLAETETTVQPGASPGEESAVAGTGDIPLPEPRPAATTEPEPVSADILAQLFQQPPFDDPLARLLSTWEQPADLPLDTAPCEHLAARGLVCLAGRGDWQEVRRYNRPVILTLTDDRGRRRRVLLEALEGTRVRLATGRGPLTVAVADLADYWAGDYLLLWRPQVADLIMGPGAQGEPVRWLRRRLALAEGLAIPADPSPQFDAELGEQVRRFQKSQGLIPDGVVGPRTLPLLNDLDPAPNTPRLTESSPEG
ncbi:MAG: peptidoglycan-binding protein, partial [Candidatus Competibacteraceae bacterium]|nr:peptidoglycan-binding protein [Candidatus Competibacteraceae bacterium]